MSSTKFLLITLRGLKVSNSQNPKPPAITTYNLFNVYFSLAILAFILSPSYLHSGANQGLLPFLATPGCSTNGTTTSALSMSLRLAYWGLS